MHGLIQCALDGAASFFTSLTFKEVLAAIWAPLSIFAGALAAFAFNNRRATRERVDKEVIEGNLALSVLMQFLNHQVQYMRNYVDPHRGSPDAWFKIIPGPPLDNGVRTELNKNNLGFLLQSSGAAWQQAILEEQRYHQVKGAIDTRNGLLEKAWSKLEAAGFEHGSKISVSDVEKTVGPVLFRQLKDIGEGLIESVTKNVTSTADAMSALRAELVRKYPKRPFISAVVVPPVPQPPPVAPPANPTKRSGLVFVGGPKGHKHPTGKYIPHEKDQ